MKEKETEEATKLDKTGGQPVEIERGVSWRCWVGLHKWDYSNPEQFQIHDYRICRHCLRMEYHSNTFNKWKKMPE